MKKSKLSILVVLAFLLAAVTLEAQAPRRGRGRARPEGWQPQSVWNFENTQDRKPLSSNPNEEKILNLLAELGASDQSNLMVPLEDGRMLRMLTEATGAKNVVEIGTYNGYSTLWFCMALLNTGGKITTHELEAKNIAMARENFKKAGVESMITIVEGDAHETVTRLKEPIDILFIDADKPGYADYLKKLMPLVRPGGFILAHNTTNTARQMPDYFEAVTNDPNLDTIFLGQQSIGLGVSLKKIR